MRCCLYTVSCIFLLAIPGLNAQSELSTGLMTASGGITYQKNSSDSGEGTSVLTLSPSVGRFLKDNLQVLVGLNYVRTSFPSNWSDDPRSSTFLTLGGRYYKPLGLGPVYGGAVFNYRKYSVADEGSSSIDIQAGMLKFLGDKLALDIGMDYNMGLGDNKSSSINAGVAVVVFFTLL